MTADKHPGTGQRSSTKRSSISGLYQRQRLTNALLVSIETLSLCHHLVALGAYDVEWDLESWGGDVRGGGQQGDRFRHTMVDRDADTGLMRVRGDVHGDILNGVRPVQSVATRHCLIIGFKLSLAWAHMAPRETVTRTCTHTRAPDDEDPMALELVRPDTQGPMAVVVLRGGSKEPRVEPGENRTKGSQHGGAARIALYRLPCTHVHLVEALVLLGIEIWRVVKIIGTCRC